MTKKHPKPLVLTGALHAIQWIWGPQNHPPKSLLWMRQLKKCARQGTRPPQPRPRRRVLPQTQVPPRPGKVGQKRWWSFCAFIIGVRRVIKVTKIQILMTSPSTLTSFSFCCLQLLSKILMTKSDSSHYLFFQQWLRWDIALMTKFAFNNQFPDVCSGSDSSSDSDSSQHSKKSAKSQVESENWYINSSQVPSSASVWCCLKCLWR